MKPINLAHEIANVDGKATLKFGEYSVPVSISTLAVNGPDRCIDIECKVSGEVKKQEKPATPKVTRPYVIDRVIFNDPATIVFWTDGTKTVVKCHKNDTYSEEVGLAMAICKKTFDNGDDFYKAFEGLIKFYSEKSKAETAKFEESVKKAYKPGSQAEDKKVEPLIPIRFIYEQFCRKNPHLSDFACEYRRPSCVTVDNVISITLENGMVIIYEYEYEADFRNFNMISFKTRDDALKALNALQTLVELYGYATIADLYDIAGFKNGCDKANKYGWVDLRNAKVEIRSGRYPWGTEVAKDNYVLNLPKPLPLT